MAADQLNKRSKSSNIIRHNTCWETQKAKKKKISHHDLNIKSNISLEWDEKKEQVVPKKEQIGIARRDLTPFLPLLPHSQNALGDVFAAPSELFQLDNLTTLLSYEVWQTHLSVQERGFLTQFLPEGAEPHKIVHELLGGNNFYFGNPFMKWGSSVCSGDCHPDAILLQEQCNKANKIAYYSELHKYHTKMIGNLQLWKERWASCANPESEFTQKMIRSRKDFHKSGSLHENGMQFGQEDEFGATSNSCSWDADDKSYTSDSPNLAITNGETIMRIPKMDLENKFYDSSGERRRSVARPRKGDKIRKLNIECGDGAKYMSYIKVSKEQHERVKSSMKHSNTSIQPRSLNHVLGNLDSFCVQPYEVFEEEERQNLHHHWLNLAKIDLPAGYENWKSWQSAKREVTKSLKKEIEDKRKSNDVSVSNLYCDNEENEETQILLLDSDHNANLDSGLVNSEDDEEEQQLVGNLCDEETNDVLLVAPEDTMERNDESLFQSEPDLNDTDKTTMQIEQTDESSEDSARNHHLPPITIHNNNQTFCPITIATNNEPDPFSSNLHEFTENMSQPDAPVSQQFPLPPAATEIWPSTTLPTSYYHQPPPVVTHGYSELSLGHPQIRRSDGGDSFFYPYPNQDTRNELLLHSLFKDPGTSYLHEHKLSRLGYHPTGGDPVATTSQFPRNLSNIQENIFADGGGRFSIPRQEPLLPLHDWPGNTHQPIQNWFSGDEVARDGWSGNQDIGNGCVTGGPVVADESLYSVLSQCNGLRSGVNFGSSGEFIQSGNYGGIGRPMGSNGVAPRAGLNYMSGNEGQSGAGGAGPLLYNHTLATILVEYASAVYMSDLTQLFTWTCSRCDGLTTGFEVLELIVDVENCLQAFVGVADDLDAIVIAFRGTQETSIQNWIEDLFWKQLDFDYPGCTDGKVHHGFFNAYNNTIVRSGILDGVSRAKEMYGDLKIMVTGHSMGGAMAAFCGLDLALIYGGNNVEVMTFGQPRIGNAAFASYYSEVVPNTFRVTHEHDLVPHLPPYYQHLPHKTYHHFPREVWLYNLGFGFLIYEVEKICDGSGEDPDCSRSVSGNSISDHLSYFGVEMGCDTSSKCRIVMAPSLSSYGKVDDKGNFALSRSPPSKSILKTKTQSQMID